MSALEIAAILDDRIKESDIVKYSKKIMATLVGKEEEQDQQPTKKQKIDHSFKLICSDCGNMNMENTIHDEISGDWICIGKDGLGCGLVLNSHALFQAQHREKIISEEYCDDYLYSEFNRFASQLKGKDKCGLLKLNNEVEKSLAKYDPFYTTQVTSEKYKDSQRSEIYNLIDHLQIFCPSLSADQATMMKKLFHSYRQKMTRIHKKYLLICTLAYIAKAYL